MKKDYETLSGEKIDVSALSQKEREEVSEIERMIAEGEDYFTVDRRVHAPLIEGRAGLQAKDCVEIYNSPKCKITFDLLERYRQKCFGPML